MQLREIMTRDVEVIRPETSVSEAEQKMRSLDLGALPVCEGQRLVGMVTDRYISIRASAYGHDPNTAPVRNYMSSDLICCFEDQVIREDEQLMRQRHVRRLPVLTREKRTSIRRVLPRNRQLGGNPVQISLAKQRIATPWCTLRGSNSAAG
jgi:CBS domain-containing protein